MKKDIYKNASNLFKDMNFEFKKLYESSEKITFYKIRLKLIKTNEFKKYKSTIVFDKQTKPTPFNLFKYHDLNCYAMDIISDVLSVSYKKEWKRLGKNTKKFYKILAYKIKHENKEILEEKELK